MDPAVTAALDLDDDTSPFERAVNNDVDLIKSLVMIRMQRQMSQAQVAQLMGRTQPAVSDFERLGGDPHLSTIQRYARAVGAVVRHSVTITGGKTESQHISFSPKAANEGQKIAFYTSATA